MANLDLFGEVITYPVVCVSCLENFEVDEEPPTKQLTFYVCDKCQHQPLDAEQICFVFGL